MLEPFPVQALRPGTGNGIKVVANDARGPIEPLFLCAGGRARGAAGAHEGNPCGVLLRPVRRVRVIRRHSHHADDPAVQLDEVQTRDDPRLEVPAGDAPDPFAEVLAAPRQAGQPAVGRHAEEDLPAPEIEQGRQVPRQPLRRRTVPMERGPGVFSGGQQAQQFGPVHVSSAASAACGGGLPAASRSPAGIPPVNPRGEHTPAAPICPARSTRGATRRFRIASALGIGEPA